MREKNRRHYYNLQLEEVERIRASGKRPSLLMHTCCAMCACYPIGYLSEIFDLTLFYYNDNIYPESEYEKRYSELERYVGIYNSTHPHQVRLIKNPYHGDEYREKMIPYKDSPEGGERCTVCFDMRMDASMKYAEDNHYDYFTTVMTVSRQKDSRRLNEIGEILQKKHPGVRYFFSDFKKDGGLEKAAEIIREYDIYRQNYCGCVYSYGEMLERARREFKAD